MSITREESEVLAEAMRTVPAIALHKVRLDAVSATGSYIAFLRTAGELGVDEVQANSVLLAAYGTWLWAAFARVAELEGRPIDQVVAEALVRGVEIGE